MEKMQEDHARMIKNYQNEIKQINLRKHSAISERSYNNRDAFTKQLDDLMRAIQHIEVKMDRNKRAAKQVDN